MKGLYGRKVGMGRIFGEDGRAIPVTALHMANNVVVRRKTVEKDGYAALVVGFEETAAQKMRKSEQGVFTKNGKATQKYIREIRGEQETKDSTVLGADIFSEGEYVDVCGQSKGKGFQGVMKRHGFGGGSITHGTHNKRKPGSVGQCAWPARIFPGRKMPGRMGGDTVTAENRRVVSVDTENGMIYVKGSVPGRKGTLVFVRESFKMTGFARTK